MFFHGFENIRHWESFRTRPRAGTFQLRGLCVPLLGIVERGSTVGTTNIDLGAPISRQHAPKSLLVDIGFALHLPLIQNGTRAHFLAPNAVRAPYCAKKSGGRPLVPAISTWKARCCAKSDSGGIATGRLNSRCEATSWPPKEIGEYQ